VTHWAGLAWNMASVDSRGFAAVWDVNSWNGEVRQLVFYTLGTLAVKIATLKGSFEEIDG
jgi:hypothetical protein